MSGTIQDPSVASEFSIAINNEQYSDITFRIGTLKICACRTILACRSPVFRAMLLGNLKERNSQEIEIMDPNVTGETFLGLMKFLYTGSVEVNTDNVLNFLYLGKIYGLDFLRNKCVEFVKEHFTEENVWVVWDSALGLGDEELIRKCEAFFREDPEKVIQATDLKGVGKELILKIVTFDELNLKELELFKFVQRWLVACPQPKETIQQIISHLRIPLIPMKDIVQHIKPTNLIPEKVLLDAIAFQICPETVDTSLIQFRTREPPLISRTKWTWKACGRNSSITDKTVTQLRTGYSLAIGNLPVTRWAVKVDKLQQGWWNLAVGIGLEDINLDDYISATKQGWGYLSMGAMKHNTGAGMPVTTESYDTGDIIRVEIEEDEVKFFKNSKFMGSMNCGTEKGPFFPVVHLCSTGDSVSIVEY